MPDLRSFHFQTWVDEFEKNLPGNTVRAAFEKAQEKFETKVGAPYYSNFESFKSSRTWRKNHKK